MNFFALPCLFDTGAHPHSYISIKTLRSLGLVDEMLPDNIRYSTANPNERFSVLGKINLTFRLPNGTTVSNEFKVADVSTEVIFVCL